MQISNLGLNLIKSDEGFKPHLYNCITVRPTMPQSATTLHHGAVCGAASELRSPGGITEQQESALLLEDVSYAEHAVEHLVTV
jgi:GH24 family phage-related lysozyme (muramidase)